MTENKISNFITAVSTTNWEECRLSNFITVFDTVIQEKNRIDTPKKADQVLTRLLAVVKDLECSNVKVTDMIDQNKLVKYGEFLTNSTSTFDLSEVEVDKVDEKKTLNNSILPTELSNKKTTISELRKKFQNYFSIVGLKFFESKQVILRPRVWDDFNQLDEWGERSNHLALFLKLTNVVRDFYNLLIKLNITIPKEDRLRFPHGFIKVETVVVKDLNLATYSVNTGLGLHGEKSYDKEKFYKGINSLLGLDSISKEKIDDAFGLDGDIFYKFYY